MPLYVKFVLGVIAYLLIGTIIALPFILDDDDRGYAYVVGWPFLICKVVIFGAFYVLKKAFDKLNKIVMDATK